MSSTRRVTDSSNDIRGSACSNAPCCARSGGVGPPRSAGMSITAALADIGPSRTIRVGIGTVPSARRRRAQRWLTARERELLDVPYVHVVFTLPHALVPLSHRNAALVYNLLFQASAATLLEVAADPRHLGAAIGFLSILHTWGQTLVRHPHVHCVVPAGGFSPDRQRWIRPKSAALLLAGEGPQSGVSRQVRRRTSPGVRARRARPRRRHRDPPRRHRVARLRQWALRHRLGRLCETGLRWGRRGAALSRPLYPSRRHQQSSADRVRW